MKCGGIDLDGRDPIVSSIFHHYPLIIASFSPYYPPLFPLYSTLISSLFLYPSIFNLLFHHYPLIIHDFLLLSFHYHPLSHHCPTVISLLFISPHHPSIIIALFPIIPLLAPLSHHYPSFFLYYDPLILPSSTHPPLYLHLRFIIPLFSSHCCPIIASLSHHYFSIFTTCHHYLVAFLTFALTIRLRSFIVYPATAPRKRASTVSVLFLTAAISIRTKSRAWPLL